MLARGGAAFKARALRAAQLEKRRGVEVEVEVETTVDKEGRGSASSMTQARAGASRGRRGVGGWWWWWWPSRPGPARVGGGGSGGLDRGRVEEGADVPRCCSCRRAASAVLVMPSSRSFLRGAR